MERLYPTPTLLTDTMTSDEDLRRRRLRFRCWHRGTREMDLMLGRFADCHLTGFDSGQLDRFESLLESSDPDLYNWISGREAAPDDKSSDVLDLLKNFKFTG
jgi:antitoxin CptB